MPASPQDFYKKVGANTVTTLAAPGKNLAATSINVGSTTNYPTDTGIVVGIRVVDSNGTIVPGTYTEWNAVVASSTAITIEAVPVYGTDQVYPAGSLTQVFLMVSSSLHNQMVDGLLVSHDQDGKLKAGAISNSNMLANNTVTTAAITDASVTQAKLSTTPGEIGGEWSSWTPGFTGYSSNPSGGQYLYKQIGKTVFVSIREPNNGTSNSTALTMTLPVAAKSTAYTYQMALVINSGTLSSGSIVVDSSASTTILSGYVGATLSNWSGSGGKRIAAVNFVYEAA